MPLSLSSRLSKSKKIKVIPHNIWIKKAWPLCYVPDDLSYADHFGGGGGPLEKTVGPAVNVMTKYGSKVLTFYTGMQVVAFDVRLLEFSLITAKGTAALWFIFGQSMPAYFLVKPYISILNFIYFVYKILIYKIVLLIQLATQMLSTVIPFPTNLNDFTQVSN